MNYMHTKRLLDVPETYIDTPEPKHFDIMNRKNGPVSHGNLVHFFRSLTIMSQSPQKEVREYALKKLKEYDPVFHKYAPEVFDLSLDLDI